MKLDLFYSEYCPFCQIVLQQVKSMGLSEYVTLCDTQGDPASSKKHFEMTGRSTVPCLYIDDRPLFESRDIMQWFKENESKIKG